jgi:hypothetical protein
VIGRLKNVFLRVKTSGVDEFKKILRGSPCAGIDTAGGPAIAMVNVRLKPPALQKPVGKSPGCPGTGYRDFQRFAPSTIRPRITLFFASLITFRGLAINLAIFFQWLEAEVFVLRYYQKYHKKKR